MKIILILIVLCSFMLILDSAVIGLKLSETGKGLNHAVIVKSKGLFKLGFENGLNYGLTQWYDLVNDPQAKIDISQNHTGYLPEHAQGALFNQCLNPDDLIGHVVSARNHFKDTPRSIKILENGAVRIVLENSYHPMLGKQNKELLFNTRYVIYPTGKIYITNTFTALSSQKIDMWRNSVLGLGDPVYQIKADTGTVELTGENVLTDKTKKWIVDQWKGFQVNLPGWISFEIDGNTENSLKVGKQVSGGKKLTGGKYSLATQQTKYGWLRGDSVTFPKSWHKGSADFIFACWDKATPAPYQEWTKASIMLVPYPGNPKQGGGGGLHGWRGYKRIYYEYGKFKMKKDEKITQYYMMALGSEKSSILPDIISKPVAKVYADDYRKPAKFANGEFDKQNGCYVLTKNKIDFDTGTIERVYPVFQLAGAAVPKVKLNGKSLQAGKDYLSQVNSDGNVIIQLLKKLKDNTSIEFNK